MEGGGGWAEEVWRVGGGELKLLWGAGKLDVGKGVQKGGNMSEGWERLRSKVPSKLGRG